MRSRAILAPDRLGAAGPICKVFRSRRAGDVSAKVRSIVDSEEFDPSDPGGDDGRDFPGRDRGLTKISKSCDSRQVVGGECLKLGGVN
jgi:hypothetical protein